MSDWEFHTRRFVVRYKDGAAEVCRKYGGLERRIGMAVGAASRRAAVQEAIDRATDTLIVDLLPRLRLADTPNTRTGS